ncbi:hypothetical protein [Pantoea sp. R102]|uniref:hypothetical protein n=1 Tax=Pantoea sp. R102 TaxID=2507583 RepID=UPI0020C0852C|nr:hypothetical protein [Pantoea sp. R102]
MMAPEQGRSPIDSTTSAWVLPLTAPASCCALGVWVGWRALQGLRRAFRPATGLQIRAVRPHHQHHADCGCGHAHLPSAITSK